MVSRIGYFDADDFNMQHALVEIQGQTGKEMHYKGKSLWKYGKNASIGSAVAETIWLQGGNEVYPTTNSIDSISSSDAADTQDVKIEGHTIDGNGDLTFTVQSATLNGQNKVTLSTPLARATRMYNDGSVDFIGDIYVYDDTAITAGVPADSDAIHLQASTGHNQSLKAATSISKDDWYVITELFAAVNERTNATVDFQLQIRLKGKVFRTVFPLVANRGAAAIIKLDPAIVVPPNSDIRFVGKSSTDNTDAATAFGGYLVQ